MHVFHAVQSLSLRTVLWLLPCYKPGNQSQQTLEKRADKPRTITSHYIFGTKLENSHYEASDVHSLQITYEKKTFIKKNKDDDVYLKRIHRGYQVQCPVRWLASGHRSRQTLKKFRFTTAAHVPGFDAAGGSFPGGT